MVQKWLLDASEHERLAGDLTKHGMGSPHYEYVVANSAGGWKTDFGREVPLDSHVPTTTLFTMLLGWAHSTRERNFDATNPSAFGRKLTEVLGPHRRMSVADNGVQKQLWAYKIPPADELRELVYKAAGLLRE